MGMRHPDNDSNFRTIAAQDRRAWKNETMISVPIHPGIEATTDEMVGLRRQIHANPELGYEEFETGQLVAERLERWGYTVDRSFGGTGDRNHWPAACEPPPRPHACLRP